MAEGTRDVAIHNDDSTDAPKGLWVGCCTMSYERSLCKTLMKHSQMTGDIPQPLIILDLSQEEEFKDHPDVQNESHMRFMACSPIISPKGLVIGAYTVLDDKPHDPLGVELVKFLSDIANTVMDHLDATRLRHERQRGERMIVGLGSFMEGKGSLRSSWINEHESVTSPLSWTPGEGMDTEGHVNQEQQDRQASEQTNLASIVHNSQTEVPFRPQNFNTTRSPRPSPSISQEHSLAASNISSRDYFQQRPRCRRASRTTTAPRMKESEKEPPKERYNRRVKETISRAANIIRESIEVEAVVFFDANFRSSEALLNTSRSDSESGSSMECASSGEEEAKIREPRDGQTRPEISREAQPTLCGRLAEDPCHMLGFATSEFASVNREPLADSNVAVSEAFLGHLLRRYPRGQIFNFGEDGCISSEDTSDGLVKIGGTKNFKRTRKAILRQDAVTLLQLAPNARSIIFSPLWDSHKERWHSACLSWTNAPHRVLSPRDELAFLFACGNSVMAEIHRLGALLTERAKSDLLAGISHELRSPLHGIFGTVDILNDTVMNVLQRGFLHTISSCAFTLLGSIDQLLEYASINDVQHKPNKTVKNASQSEPAMTDQREAKPGKLDKESSVQLDATVEDAIETVFAGHSFFKAADKTRLRKSVSSKDHPFSFEGGVKVILDIDHSKDLSFTTRPGAWHVILTNFFGNALKFTDTGFIYVSLKANPLTLDSDGKALQSQVTLCIKDTGCGMEEDFLKNELFTAFSKEDKLSIGNGLGINIVHRIVSSLGGDIQISSQKGVGTEVVTTVTLDQTPQETSSEDKPKEAPFPISIRELVKGKKVGVLLHTASDGDAALLSSIHRLCENWFQMTVELVEPSEMHLGDCDFYISLHESLAIGNHGIMPIRHRAGDRPKAPVIIVCSSPRIAHTLASHDRKDAGVFEFISQPCGPYKLAKSLEICVQRQKQRDGSLQKDISLHKLELREYGLQLMGKTNNEITPPDSTGSNASPGPLKIPIEATNEYLTPPALLVTPGWDENALAEDYLAAQSQSQSLVPPGTILLVDDNEINLKILVAYMKKLGYSFAAARNGQEALDIFTQHARNIEVILMGWFSRSLYAPIAI